MESHGIHGEASAMGEWVRSRGSTRRYGTDAVAGSVVAGDGAGWAETPDGSWAVVDGSDTATAERLLRLVLGRGVAGAAVTTFNCTAVIWDAAAATLTVCRFGGSSRAVYVRTDGPIEWSSRASALYRAGDTLDQTGIAGFITAGAGIGRRTLVEAVERVAPGEAWTFAPGRTDVSVVWRPEWDGPSDAPFDERRQRVREAFTRTLARQTEGRTSVGLLLSSGIDSVFIATGLRRYVEVPATAFTVTYEGYDGVFDEYDAADRVAKALGMAHEPIRLGPDDIIDHLPWMVSAYDGPCSYGLHTSMLGSVVASGTDVLFSGAGGDEWWAMPYERLGAQLRRWVPGPVSKVAADVLEATRFPRSGRLVKGLRSGHDLARIVFDEAAVTPDHRMRRALVGPVADDAGRELVDYYRTRAHEPDMTEIQRGSFLWAFIVHPDHYGDWTNRWGAAYGIPVASPLLDPPAADEFVVSAIDKADRAIFRSLAAEWMPPDAAGRPKVSQSLPLAEWFRGPLGELVADTLHPREVAADGMLDPEAVSRLVAEHTSGRASHPWQLWMAISLSYWKRFVFDPGTSASDAAPTP